MPRNSNPRANSQTVLASAIELPRQQWLESLERRQLLSSAVLGTSQLTLLPQAASTGSVQGYTPSQIRTAYGFNQVSFSNSSATPSGAGQTIAIVDAYNDPDIKSDLATFDSQFGLAAAPSFSVVSQTGSSTLPQSNADAAMEISLDVEWAHAIAPGANILLVEANSDSISSLMTAVNYARNIAGVSTISLSWGSGEFSGENSYNTDFTTPAGHTGETFVVASGDSGAAEGADWPAVVPSVLSVGGTTLTLNSTGSYSSESTWSDSTGGISAYESEPSYQQGVQTTGKRETPDVAYDANPNTGFAVYDSVSDDGEKGWEEVGGTSAGAPQWAALVAIADQGRKIAGETNLDGATGTLPILYTQDDTTTAYSTAFHDVTTGSVVGSGFGGGGFGFSRSLFTTGTATSATVGYDEVTGLGSPQAKADVAALIAGKVSITASPNKSTATTGTGSTGSTGSGSTGTTPTPPPFHHGRGGWGGFYAEIATVTVPAPAPALTTITPAVLAHPATASLASTGSVLGGSGTAAQGESTATAGAALSAAAAPAQAARPAIQQLSVSTSPQGQLTLTAATTDSTLVGQYIAPATYVVSQARSVAAGVMQSLTPHGQYSATLVAAAQVDRSPFSKTGLAIAAGGLAVAAYASQRRRTPRRSAR